jgi:uncharacterized BrkB/YihY/UPF0761 family membrane protein
MSFLQWYGSGIVILLALFGWQAYTLNDTIRQAVDEVYDIFIRKADVLSTSILLILSLLGPLLLPAIAYFKFREWQDSLAVDEDGNRDYPWSKE